MSDEHPEPPRDESPKKSVGLPPQEGQDSADETVGLPPSAASDQELSAAVSLAWEDKLTGAETPEATIGVERVRVLSTLPALTRKAKLHDGTGGTTARLPRADPAAVTGTLGAAAGAEDETIGPAPADASGERVAPPPTLPSTGEVDYELVGIVGKGGMGIVYLARQSSLRREVALKRPFEDVHPQARESFLREALVTGELEHPGIVPVHDLAVDESGRPLMSMKLVRGRPWSERLHESGDGALTLRENLDILIRACDAIAFAHGKGIVNRDIKPENVMVGDYGEVYVVDWGIAVDVRSDEAVAKAAPIGRASGPAGTPRYMAPELALGRRELIGPRTDIYLLGGCLHELLTGSPPHEGKGLNQVLNNAARGRVTDPRERAPERAIASELAEICLKAMAAKPEDRYDDVPAFQRALRGFLEHQASLALTDEAAALIERIDRDESVLERDRHALLEETQATLGQALRTWPENRRALELQARVAERHADHALRSGDHGVARRQIALLETSSRADEKRLASLRGDLERRERRRRWAGGLLALVVLAALAAQQGLVRLAADGTDRLEAALAEARATDRLRSALRRTTLSNETGEPARILGELRAPGYSGAPRLEVRLATAEWLLAVVHWSRGNWDQLLESLMAEQWDLEWSPTELLALTELPEVAGTSLGDEIRRAVESESRRGLTGHLVRAARQGVPDAPLRALVERLEDRWLESEASRREKRVASWDAVTALARRRDEERLATLAAWRSRLRRAAFLNVAADARARRGEPRTPDVLPYVVSAVPFGRPTTQVDAPTVFLNDSTATWVASDPLTGAERWRLSAQLTIDGRQKQQAALPVADGSLLLLADAIVRVDGASGAVLGRWELGAQGLVAWPEPTDPTRLVVASLFSEADVGLTTLRADERLSGPLGLEEGSVSWRSDDVTPALRREHERTLRAEGLEVDEVTVRTRLIDGLQAHLALDPRNPSTLVHLLRELGSEPSPRQRAVAEDLVAALEGEVRVATASAAAVELERAGHPDLADRAHERALELAVDRGVNPDFLWQFSAGANPAIHAWDLAAEHLREGRAERGLRWLDAALELSPPLGLRNELPERRQRWLEREGRSTEAQALRRQLALHDGRSSLLRVDLVDPFAISCFGLSLFLGPFAALPVPILLALAWLRARPTRLRDLAALGFSTAVARTTAWIAHPRERLARSTLAYCRRSERAGLAFLAGLAAISIFLLLTIYLVAFAWARTVGFPTAASPSIQSVAEEQLIEDGPRPWTLSLIADGRYLQSDPVGAEMALTLQRDSLGPTARVENNLAVLAEKRADLDAAREGYRRSMELGGAAAAVARWNLARLDGAPADTPDDLAPRDRTWISHGVAGGPAWATCASSDLAALACRGRSVASLGMAGLTQLVANRLGSYDRGSIDLQAMSDGESNSMTLRLLRFSQDAFMGWLLDAWLVLIIIALACLGWCPARVRALDRREPVKRGRLRQLAFRLAALVLPGLRDVARGRRWLGIVLWLTPLTLAGLKRAAKPARIDPFDDEGHELQLPGESPADADWAFNLLLAFLAAHVLRELGSALLEIVRASRDGLFRRRRNKSAHAGGGIVTGGA